MLWWQQLPFLCGLGVGEATVLTLELEISLFSFPCHVYVCIFFHRYSIFSRVQPGTPVCCCNYFDYTYHRVFQQTGERSQFHLPRISIPTPKQVREKKWNIWLVEGYSNAAPFVCDCNKQLGCTLVCEVPTSFHFWLVLAWWLAVRIQTGDDPGSLAALPEDGRLPDSEQMLTNRNKKHARGTRSVRGPPAFGLEKGARATGSELRRGRTCSHGHLPLHDVSQENWQAKADFYSAATGKKKKRSFHPEHHPISPRTHKLHQELICLPLTFLVILLFCPYIPSSYVIGPHNLYIITALWADSFFFQKLACNYNVLAATNILYELYGILFFRFRWVYDLTWHPGVSCIMHLLPFVFFYPLFTLPAKVGRLLELHLVFHHLQRDFNPTTTRNNQRYKL